ncbi:hypothetical protein Pmar_PMAR015806 [Perkinsus marinus ATCC 50983]|uniref:Uncharacterized protein n=1 Tax=Perkinsus marinus (strain ATCC 50983 / TXsc) TaxID=423536 RepID=C5KRD6_PERM5|nr:hypothetical protein Pmar_PMAR015806 [Perkinsus marinus ATCC 50983]EER12957.1 hypothetical protein Pmar_PMAR015806 [Perkinsus marinus ATCC 50983]|eukprot:XP_002781162.1 hypothetical protein Pmar_PMAR015806 [Perkinsus marinus ATCC 50983]
MFDKLFINAVVVRIINSCLIPPTSSSGGRLFTARRHITGSPLCEACPGVY